MTFSSGVTRVDPEDQRQTEVTDTAGLSSGADAPVSVTVGWKEKL